VHPGAKAADVLALAAALTGSKNNSGVVNESQTIGGYPIERLFNSMFESMIHSYASDGGDLRLWILLA
jgi:hypothetical protein